MDPAPSTFSMPAKCWAGLCLNQYLPTKTLVARRSIPGGPMRRAACRPLPSTAHLLPSQQPLQFALQGFPSSRTIARSQ